MRAEPPGPVRDLARLRVVARRRESLEAEFLALVVRLREYDPAVPWATIAKAAGFKTDGGAILLVRRAEERAAKAPHQCADCGALTVGVKDLAAHVDERHDRWLTDAEKVPLSEERAAKAAAATL